MATLQQIAMKLTDKVLTENSEEHPLITKLRNDLKEAPTDAKHYRCESCGMITENDVFRYSHGECLNCGSLLSVMEESDYSTLQNITHLTCPNCKSIKPQRINESSVPCSVCGKMMMLYTPLNTSTKK